MLCFAGMGVLISSARLRVVRTEDVLGDDRVTAGDPVVPLERDTRGGIAKAKASFGSR